jgi:hypothetical protein
MANNDVTMKVALDDRASAELKKIASALKNLANETKTVSPSAAQAGMSFGKLTAALGLANLGAMAVTTAVNFTKDALVGTIDASNRMTSAMMGLSSLAGAFGQSQTEARQAAQDLAQDGLMTVTEAATGLKNLLATGFSIPEAINLMEGFKDAAANNRQGSLAFGEAVVGTTEGIKNQNSIMSDNGGITKNLSLIIAEQGGAVTDLSKVTSDAATRQRLYNGLLVETTNFSGDAGRMAETLQGSQAKLNKEMFDLQAMLGAALSPALQILIDGFRSLVGDLSGSVGPNLNNIAKGAAFVATVFNNMAAIVIRVGKAIAGSFKNIGQAAFALMKGDFDSFNDSMNRLWTDNVENFDGMIGDFVDNGMRMMDTFDKIDTKGVGAFQDIDRNGVKKMTNSIDKAGQKLAEQMAKIAREFNDSMTKMSDDFDRNMQDLVVAHREKKKQLESDINEENSTFSERMTERKDDFNNAMLDIEKRHAEKVQTIQDQMTEETRKITDEMRKIDDKYKESLDQFQQAGKERLSSLQVQIDKEKAKGKYADEQKVASMEGMLSKEKVSLDQQLLTKQQIIDDEKKAVQDEYNVRLSALQDSLAKENAEVEASRVAKQSEYEKETAKVVAEHEKRLNSLNEQLNKEKEIERKYADDFAKFKDAVAEDDITRLKANFARERAELEKQHEQKLSDLARRAQEERATTSAASVKGSGQSGSLAQQAASVKPSTTSASQYDKIDSNALQWINLSKYADGGVFNRPTVGMFAEAGPEAIVPLNNPRRADEVMRQAGLKNNVTINMPVTVVSSDVDIDMIAERVAFKMAANGIK